ncbi:MAG: DUF3833 family protein [Pseudomonadota bacterium]
MAEIFQPDWGKTLRLEDYFAGTTVAWGVFEDRFGKLRRQFRVVMTGVVENNVLTLREDFLYDDGEEETRTWSIRILGDGTYEGTAPGVLGRARGSVVGMAFSWRYGFDLPIGGGKTLRVTFDDRFYLQGDGVMINRARVSKLGLLLGEATIVFSKADAEMDRQARIAA